MLVIGVDIGSVRRPGGFSWAAPDDSVQGQDDPSALGAAVVAALDAGEQVALGVECPLSVPVPAATAAGWPHLGRARDGDGTRSWSAGAGTGALATGLVQLAWLCRYVAERRPATAATTRLDRFVLAGAELFVAEAMVTGEGKPEPVGGADHADAVAAARRLAELLAARAAGDPVAGDVTCAPHVPLNLAAAAMLHAGLAVDPDKLRQDVLVAKARPVVTG